MSVLAAGAQRAVNKFEDELGVEYERYMGEQRADICSLLSRMIRNEIDSTRVALESYRRFKSVVDSL